MPQDSWRAAPAAAHTLEERWSDLENKVTGVCFESRGSRYGGASHVLAKMHTRQRAQGQTGPLHLGEVDDAFATVELQQEP